MSFSEKQEDDNNLQTHHHLCHTTQEAHVMLTLCHIATYASIYIYIYIHTYIYTCDPRPEPAAPQGMEWSSALERGTADVSPSNETSAAWERNACSLAPQQHQHQQQVVVSHCQRCGSCEFHCVCSNVFFGQMDFCQRLVRQS